MKVSRRMFLWSSAVVGGGLALGIAAPRVRRWIRHRRRARPLGASAWIEISPSGSMRLFCNATEMGQGTWSGLAQLVCEEMDADWSRIKVEMAPVETAFYSPWGYGTGGSRSVRGMFDMMRRIGAAARVVLIQAASVRWQVPESECATQPGFVVHVPTGRRLDYGALAGAAAEFTPPFEPALKARTQWKVIGQSLARVDLPAKVDGTAVYGMDLRLPGMRFATLAHCPAPGGRLKNAERDKAGQVPGVENIVEMPQLVAVIARDTWSAMRGLERLAPTWEIGEGASVSSDAMWTSLRKAVEGTDGTLVADDRGAREAAERTPEILQRASQRHSATYEAPLISHAQLEPMNCTAWVTADRAEVWAPTQQQSALRAELARVLGLAADKIVVHTPYLGGGFGRRLKNDYAIEAALIAREANHPVQLVWSREEDFAAGFFRPAACARFEAGLDAEGNLQALDVRVASLDQEPRLGGIPEQPYAIPARAMRYSARPQGIRLGSWRSVDMSQNTFFLESFLDECALKGGRDPLEFRRHLLRTNARAQRVLDAVAEMADWRNRIARGRHLGLAFASGFGSMTAQIAEVDLIDGKIRIARMFVALDCGIAVNPDAIDAQLQGGILMALSAALGEEVTVEKGRVRQLNYDTYDVLRLRQAPAIQTRILEAAGAAAGGVGELGVPPTAPAIANAVFAATGIRIRSMPMRRNTRLVWTS